MNNLMAGYRKMLGFSQKEMAELLDISTTAYFNKEHRRTPFNDSEKVVIKELLTDLFPDITIDEIFFTKNTKKYKEVEG